MEQFFDGNLIVCMTIRVWIIWDHLKRNRSQLGVCTRTKIVKPNNLIRLQINGLKLLIIHLLPISESIRKYSKIWKFELIIISCLSIAHYTSVSTLDSIFIMGGKVDWGNSGTIAQFKGRIWSLVGDLKIARQGPSAISHGSQTLVIGGTATSDL